MLCIRIDTLLVMATLVVVMLPAGSESSPITFERTFGGAGTDLGLSVQQTTDGGYIVTGASDDLSDTAAALLVKTDAYGDTLWTRKFGGTQRAADGAWVQQTNDSGFAVVGNADSSGSGPGGVWLIKTAANGDTSWSRTYSGFGASMFDQTVDSGYVIVGNTSYFGPSGADVCIVNADASGDTLWTRTYGGASDDVGNSIEQTTDGGYIIAANTMSFGAGSQDVWLIKTDSMGDTLWTRTFGGDSLDFAGSAEQTDDGGYIVAGYTFSYSASPQFYLIKTNADGETLWTKTIGGPGWVEGNSVEQAADGGYIIVGICGTVLPDVYLVRADSNGDTLWTRTFGGSDFDAGYCVRQTADGGYVVCGQTYSFGAGESDFYFIKTDENGNVAVAEPKASAPRTSVLSLTCEPNPFHSSTVLHLTTGPLDHSATHLRIYDVQGRLVRTLAASQATQTMWDGRNDVGQLLPSGTYLVRCDVAGEHATARLILQR